MSAHPRGDADRHVTVTEVGTRDGFQAEAAFIPTETKAEVVDALVAAGVRSILNFAPVVLAVPEDVEVRKVDLAVELQILAFHEQRRSEEHEPRFAHPSSDAETSFDPESLGEAINA